MISKNRNITFRIENVCFRIGIYHITAFVELYNVILKCPYIRTVLHQSIRINKVLMVVFELPYGIASGCFDVVDAGRHQLVNYPINQNIAVCGWKNRFYSLLG